MNSEERRAEIKSLEKKYNELLSLCRTFFKPQRCDLIVRTVTDARSDFEKREKELDSMRARCARESSIEKRVVRSHKTFTSVLRTSIQILESTMEYVC